MAEPKQAELSKADSEKTKPKKSTTSDDSFVVAFACGVIALVVSILASSAVLAVNDWDVSTLVRMSELDPLSSLARQVNPGFSLGPLEIHYDGVYYYAIGLDPLALGEAHTLIDLAAHRYGHPAYGWMAWLLSLGRPESIPLSLFVLSLVGMFVGSVFVSFIARDLGASPWAGLIVALNPGLVFAVTADTSEALSTAVLAVALWLWIRDKQISGAIVLTILCFFKFQLILIPVGLGLWEVVRYLRGDRSHNIKESLALLSIGPFLYGLWQLYIHQVLGVWPTSLGPSLLAPPILGWLETMGQQGNIKQFAADSQLLAAQLPVLACVLALFVIGVIASLRLRSTWDCVFLLQGLMLLCLNYWNLFYPKELLRVTAIPAILIFAVFSRRAHHPLSLGPTPEPEAATG